MNEDHCFQCKLWIIFVNFSASSGGVTGECWQKELQRLLVEESDNVLNRAQLCVAHYAEDINSKPPRGLHRLVKA